MSAYGSDTSNYAPGASVDPDETGSKRGRALTQGWKDLTAKQQERFGDKSSFKAAKQEFRQNAAPEEPRMAGDRLRGLKERREGLRASRDAGEQINESQLNRINNKIKSEKNSLYGDGSGTIADSFDAAATGAGSQRGVARVSKADMKELERRYGKQAVVDYMDGLAGNEDIKTSGTGAQNLLARYKSELTNSTVDPDQPDPGNPDNDNGSTIQPAPNPGTPAPPSQQPPDQVPMPGMPTMPGVGGDMTQNNDTDQTNNQNNQGGNDTGSIDVSGNGNTVSLDQSETIIGGDQSNVSINAQGMSAGDAARLALVAGVGKPSNSRASAAAFTATHQAMNDAAQKDYRDVGATTANKYIQNAMYTNPVDMDLLNQNINDRESYHRSAAMVQGLHAFGDMMSSPAPKFNMPGPMNPVDRSDLDNANEQARDDLNDDD